MSSDNQLRKHASIHVLTVFGSSDERVLLRMQPACRTKQSFSRNCRLPVHLLEMGEKSKIVKTIFNR